MKGMCSTKQSSKLLQILISQFETLKLNLAQLREAKDMLRFILNEKQKNLILNLPK